jgi:hypothetical protein
MSTSTNVRDDFVVRIESYCRAHGISEDKFGKVFCNGDHHAVPWLRRGRATLKRLEQIDAVLRADRPVVVATKKAA